MVNEKKTIAKETGSNLTPIVIIGVILLATIFGIYMIMKSGGKETVGGDKNSSTSGNKKSSDGRIANYDSAPAGAAPAHFKGNAGSPVVIEEFADFQCPTCRIVHPKMNEIISKYGNRIKVVFRQYPVTQPPKAYDAAVATEAAGLQGKFWEMQNIMFNNQTSWANSQTHRQDYSKYAKQIGLDVEKFEIDLLGMAAKQRVDSDMKRGKALNISSTPSILINGRLVPYSQMEVAQMSTLIDAELAKFNPKKEEKSDGKKEEKPKE